MARSWQKFMAVGNVGKTPEIRTTNGGRRCAQFPLATSRMWRDAQGRSVEKKEWHRCVAWNPERGPQWADILERHVERGDQLFVEGRIEYRSYKDRATGRDVWVTEVNVTDLVMLGPPKRQEGETPSEVTEHETPEHSPYAVGDEAES